MRPAIPSPQTNQTSSTTSSLTTSLSSISSTSSSVLAKSREGCAPVGNYDHWHYEILLHEIEQFARWDMFTVNFETAHYARDALKEIKNLNPKTRILVWISLGFYKIGDWGGYLETKFLADSSEDWWIHIRGTGPPSSRRYHNTPWYPDLVHPNPKSGFADHIVKFLQEEILSTELYDGVFFDATGDARFIFPTGHEQLDVSPSEYTEGIADILKNTRNRLLGPDGIIMGNPGDEWPENCPYWEYANGHYQENALGDVFGSDWSKMWAIYQRNMRKKSPPARMHWIGVDTQYKRDRSTYGNVTQKDVTDEDLRRMRLGLGTALLLDNGYFGFDLGDGYHGYGEQWWFPEYDANLGFPSSNYEKAGDGTYRRRYDNGLVIVNPGFDRTIDLGAKYRDATTSQTSNRITVPGNDARLLVTA